MSETIQELRREVERLEQRIADLEVRCGFLANAAADAMLLQAVEFGASESEKKQ